MTDLITFNYRENKNQKNLFNYEKYFTKRTNSVKLCNYFKGVISNISDIQGEGLHLNAFFKRGENSTPNNPSLCLQIFPSYGRIDKKSIIIKRGKISLLENKVEVCELKKNEQLEYNSCEEFIEKINIYFKKNYKNGLKRNKKHLSLNTICNK